MDVKSEGTPLVFAYYVSGQGFGHATRSAEVVHNLVEAGHDVHVVTGAPEYIFTSSIQSPKLSIRKVLLDCGHVHADALTIDRVASLDKYIETAVKPRASILTTEVQWLISNKVDLVVSDVVPIACRAAVDAGIRSVCISNASWDFIYAEYVMAAAYGDRSIIWQIAGDYSFCEFLLRLPGSCPMPAFRDVIDVPLVVRRLNKSQSEVRNELGVGDDVKVLIYNFGELLTGWRFKEDFLPPGWVCWVCSKSEVQELPSNFIKLPKDVYLPDLVAASDCMLGKIGYGTLSESLAYKTPFIFVRRDYCSEEPFLRNLLEYHECGVEMARRDLLAGVWAPYIERACSLKPCYDKEINGAEVAALRLQDTAYGKIHRRVEECGVRRLRDAIVLGYQLQRAPGGEVSVPKWYSHAQDELVCRSPRRSDIPKLDMSPAKQTEDFQILHGDHQDLLDTISFLKSLGGLQAQDSGDKHQAREVEATASLFNWEGDIFVARAPGRLDVMGGIADYSGSLVLQMPIREACHVAIQTNPPSTQPLWAHAKARQDNKEHGPTPVLQIVSLGSELGNRGPIFDMDLSDFMEDGKPISYEKARDYFAQNPSVKWAAYVAGPILILMTKLGVRFEDGISMLVSSGVPEGKGVSSSAAIEVASMSAIAAAHGISISPRDIALYCQMVENHIVGAPCGVMDQMASACGEANKFLAMLCQPAEVLGLIEIPRNVRFWGIDSGIRHSVGGADYGTVRIGAFMGQKMVKTMASAQLSESDTLEESGKDLLEREASLKYLCNLPPHRYEASYADKLPKSLSGQEFIEKYKDHDDAVTTIDETHIYPLKAATRHPVYENFRVQAFKSLLSSSPSVDQLTALGELMYQCHYSYGACGLGSDGTDRLVDLVQEMQHRRYSESEKGTLYGAKITGGGSGGAVCVMGEDCMRSGEQILEIQRRYEAATGFLPYIFEGSSPGAGKFGHLKVRLLTPSDK